jgi:hypothetical protein
VVVCWSLGKAKKEREDFRLVGCFPCVKQRHTEGTREQPEILKISSKMCRCAIVERKARRKELKPI